jgi:hypothetical protein
VGEGKELAPSCFLNLNSIIAEGEIKMDKAGKRLSHNDVIPDKDLVKHHYNRRGLVGPQAMLFRRNHPMSWKQVSGNYQT